MAVTIPAGLGTTLGVSQEATFGTELAPSRWFMIEASEGFELKKNIVQSKALHGGLFELGTRRVVPTSEAVGKFKLDVTDKQMGILFKNMLASSAVATQQGTSAAYLQNHTPGITVLGQSLCFQKAVPATPSGTIQPFTYAGCKVTDWTLSCKVDGILELDLSLDSVKEDTSFAYSAPSFVASHPFHFAQGAVLLGGTVSTTSGVMTISGGAAPVALVTSVEIKGARKLDVKRFGIGQALKAEQVEADFYEITGELEMEFANLADYYTAMAADTHQALQINFTGGVIATGYNAFVNIGFASVAFDSSPVVASSVGPVVVKVPFKALDDGLGDPVIQIAYQSTDTTV
jgi:hypothetical protein